jgi:anti-sigma B factor antagonist
MSTTGVPATVSAMDRSGVPQELVGRGGFAGPHDGCRCRATSRDGVAVVEVAGEIDLAAGPELEATLGAAVDGGLPTVIVDLEAVVFIDARGLGVLARAKRCTDEAGTSLMLRRPSAACRRLLDVAGLTAAFVVCD